MPSPRRGKPGLTPVFREKIATPNTLVDPDDAPELTEEWFQRADLHQGEKLLRRGRPVAEVTKTPIKLRLDPDIVNAFKAGGRGWASAHLYPYVRL